MTQDPERLAPFGREPKACAQLDHPSIVTIHSVQESDGIYFLTMQLGRKTADVIKAFRRTDSGSSAGSQRARRQAEKSFGFAIGMKIA